MPFRVETGIDDQVAWRGDLMQIQMGLQCHAVAGVDGLAAFAQTLPTVELAAIELVGDTQRLDGRQQRHHGVVGQQQEGDGDNAIVVGDKTGIGVGDHAVLLVGCERENGAEAPLRLYA